VRYLLARLVVMLATASGPASALAEIPIVTIASDADDVVGRGAVEGTRTNVFLSHPLDDAVTVAVRSNTFALAWGIALRAPAGQPLVAGSYPNATGSHTVDPTRPVVSVRRGPYQDCTTIEGSFVIHEIAYQGEAIERLAADFEQRCNGAPGVLRGAVRYRVGDDDCEGAPNGTPCDDRNACTASSACQGETCVSGAEVVACDPTPGQCETGLCHPGTGECVGRLPVEDGTLCDDGEPCTRLDTCVAGVCAATERVRCDDGSHCTDDVCRDGEGCTYTPLPGRCGVPGTPASFVFLRRDPGGYGSRTQWRMTPADAQLSVRPRFGGIAVDASGTDDIRVEFHAPGGGALAPGSYAPAAGRSRWPFEPGLELNLLECSSVGGFTIHDVAQGPAGEVLRFSADFQLACRDRAGEASGSVRYRSADLACAGAADGTPCDPDDACLRAAECRSGLCTVTDAVTCATPTDGCSEAAVCDPRSGACLEPAPAFDGKLCDDGSACTVDDACEGGRCIGDVIACTDGDVCTDDACEPTAGCVSTPIAGTCWNLEGRTRYLAGSATRICRCRATSTATLALFDDGRFRMSCADGSEESGVLRDGRGGRRFLDVAALDALAGACRPVLPNRTKYTTWIQPSQEGQSLRGRRIEHSRGGSPAAQLRARTRFRGTQRGTPGALPPASDACAAELSACLPR